MKNALEWIKSNPISVAAGGVALVGLVVIIYIYLFSTSAFQKEKAEVLKGPYAQQTALAKSTVPLPNEDPNAEPDIKTVVINKEVINEVQKIYSEINTQYLAILDQTSRKNSERHLSNPANRQSVLLARGAVWPSPKFEASYEQAKADYLEQHKALFTPKDEGWSMPSFRAGSPPMPFEVQRALAKSAFNFVNSIGVASPNELSQTQAEQLYAEQRMVLMKMLTERAQSINLYVSLPRDQDIFAPELAEPGTETTTGGGFDGLAGDFTGGFTGGPDQGANANAAGYPFTMMDWVYTKLTPNPDEVWEGQVQLWITRDIMQAIYVQNKVDTTRITGSFVDAEGKTRPIVEPNVINSPVKRLLTLQIVNGYVGLHTAGGVVTENQSFDNSSRDDGIRPILVARDTTTGSSGFTPDIVSPSATDTNPKRPSVYPDPPTTLAPLDPKEKAPEHFGITPTGRVSNSVFDVRHTRLVIDIEWEALPRFIEQLRETNFMTVIGMNLEDIDEYQILREGGYVYGDADVVRVELIIESLWFRNWTEKLMPTSVKQKLLIIMPEPPVGGGFGGSDIVF